MTPTDVKPVSAADVSVSTLTRKQVREIVLGLRVLSQVVMPARAGGRVAEMRLSLEPLFDAGETERKKLIARFCAKDDKGKDVLLPEVKDDNGKVVLQERYDLSGNQAAFDQEWTDFLAASVDVPPCRKLRLAEFTEKFNIEPEVWFLLAPVLRKD